MHLQGKSDEALERHLVDLRAQNAELISGNFSGSDRMQSALAAAMRLASMLSSNQSQDTIQQAMAVLDSVNKKLYGMIDLASGGDASKSDQQHVGKVQSTATSQSLDSVRGYGDDDDDDEYRAPQYGYGMASELDRQKRPSSPTGPSGLGTSQQQQQRSTIGPSKRFHFGL